MYRNRATQNLVRQIKKKTEMLCDPLQADKAALMQQIEGLNRNLLTTTDLPYFCNSCGYMHRKGQIYADHKSEGRIKLKWSPVSPKKFTTLYKMTMGDLSILRSVELCRQIPPYAKVTVYLEDFRGEQKIGVVYNRRKIGGLKRIIGGLPSYFREENTDIDAFFAGFSETGTAAHSPHALIHVAVFRKEKIVNYTDGILELAALGHPDLSNAFLMWTPKARDHAITHLNSLEHPHKAKIIAYLEKVEKYHYRKDNEFPIML